ncbi:MAG: S1C family serine protease [Candidatus Dormibacteria bacterium]
MPAEPQPPPLGPPEWSAPGPYPDAYAYDPYGYDAYGYGPWAYQPWMQPPPPVRRRSAARWLVAVLMLVFIVAGAGAGVAILASRGGVIPFTSSAGRGGAVSGSVDQVDQAVVDVTSRLSGDQGVAAGTGMVLSSSGQVLTNNHVIEGSSNITVQVNGSGPRYTATVVGDDPVHDVALLQVQGVSNLSMVTLADSSAVAVGDAVTAIGNALGQGGTPSATDGKVTALGETITVSDETGGSETLSNLIEMNAQIQPGDSGGPLIDSAGKVVGMDTAAEVSGSRRHSPSTAGYAIPINDALNIVKQIQNGGGGTVETGNPPVIGVEVSTSDTNSTGVPISGVQAGSPADKAGIQAGDVITAADGHAVNTSQALRNAIRAHKSGDQISVAWRDASGAAHTATVTLVAGPPA